MIVSSEVLIYILCYIYQIVIISIDVSLLLQQYGFIYRNQVVYTKSWLYLLKHGLIYRNFKYQSKLIISVQCNFQKQSDHISYMRSLLQQQ